VGNPRLVITQPDRHPHDHFVDSLGTIHRDFVITQTDRIKHPAAQMSLIQIRPTSLALFYKAIGFFLRRKQLLVYYLQ
jgi:hypothetical protein